MSARLRRVDLALVGVLALAFGLRLWSIDHGLPFVYNADEELHFVPRAVAMVGGSLNPQYFENPPALTYLLLAVFKLRFGVGFPFGGHGFARDVAADPRAAFLTARIVVALLGTLVVWLVFAAGRRWFDRRVGLVAAALMACAFLPVFYSKLALNDVATLVPVTLALIACAGVLERGGRRDWALAGAAVGAAAATKYTAAGMVVPLALAGALGAWTRAAGGDRRSAWRPLLAGGAVAAGAAAAVFLVLNPYALLDFAQFRREVGGQSATAGGAAKLGQSGGPGWVYYLWTLGWGFGVAPAIAALAGGVLALRGDRVRGAVLVAFPLFLYLFLGGQARYFGRWLLPAYPMIAVLAAFGAVRAADALARRRAGWGRFAVAGFAALLVVQGLAASVRVDAVLGQRDTRSLARTWLLATVPAGTRIVLEPFTPGNYLTLGAAGRRRWIRYPVQRPFQAYEKRLAPALVDAYRAQGYCTVIVASTQKQRGLRAGLRGAQSYYERLAAESARTVVFSPYRADRRPVPFNFDLSFDYLPRAYARPGPLIEVHRLRACPLLGAAVASASGRGA